jgi:hypothetical protein
MLISGNDALLIFFTLITLLALCVAVAPAILVPADMRVPPTRRKTPRAE